MKGNAVRKSALPEEAQKPGDASGVSRPKHESERRGRIDQLLLDISNDARRRKGRYLEDSVVPEGGE